MGPDPARQSSPPQQQSHRPLRQTLFPAALRPPEPPHRPAAGCPAVSLDTGADPFEAALVSAVTDVEAVCTLHNVNYLAYHACPFPIAPEARQAAARA
eukprot:5837391-Pleurochrysis_carterae.AAC.1